MQKALKPKNNKVLNEGLFTFYKQIVKQEPGLVIESGAISKIIEIVNVNQKDRDLVKHLNSILSSVQQDKHIPGRLQLLMDLIRENRQDKQLVQSCLQNILELVVQDIDSD